MKPLKTWLVLLFAVAGMHLAHAEDHVDSVTTLEGKTYSDVTILRSNPDGIDIIYEKGGAHIPFEKLPKDLQSKYGYDPEKQKAFLAKQEQDHERQEATAVIAASLNDIRKHNERLAFHDIKIGNDSITSSSYSIAGMTSVYGGPVTREGMCIVTEIKTTDLASGQSWIGNVWRVGTFKQGESQYAHFTANLDEWARKQSLPEN